MASLRRLQSSIFDGPESQDWSHILETQPAEDLMETQKYEAAEDLLETQKYETVEDLLETQKYESVEDLLETQKYMLKKGSKKLRLTKGSCSAARSSPTRAGGLAALLPSLPDCPALPCPALPCPILPCTCNCSFAREV